MSNESFDLDGSASSFADDDSLPIELLPVHQRLVEDGATWRAHVAPAQPVIAGARSRLLAATLTPDAPSPVFPPDEADLLPKPAGPDLHWSGRARRGMLATVAAVLLVGLMGGALYSMASQRSSQRRTSTPTVAQSPTALPNRWQPVAALSNRPGMPVLAPSDPRIVYEADTAYGQIALTLKRSDDGGATWHTLPVPQHNGSALENVQVRVSPLNADLVLLQGIVPVPHFTPSSCDQIAPIASIEPHPTGIATIPGTSSPRLLSAASPASDAGECTVAFISEDGGQHWSPAALPAGGTSPSGYSLTLNDLGTVQVQSNRLYMTPTYLDLTSGAPNYTVRLDTSADGGKTWRAADSSLLRQVAAACAFLVDPAGTAIYAESAPNNCGMGSSHAGTIWRSDDAGAHWRKVGVLPAVFASLVTVIPSADGQHLVLLAYVGPTPSTPAALAFSIDDGATWKSAPMGTIPAHSEYIGASTVVLDDGTIIAPFVAPPSGGQGTPTPTPIPGSFEPPSPFDLAYFAWKPGAATWTRASPALTVSGQLESVIVDQTSASSGVSLTLVVQSGDGNNLTYDVFRCGLAFSGG